MTGFLIAAALYPLADSFPECRKAWARGSSDEIRAYAWAETIDNSDNGETSRRPALPRIPRAHRGELTVATYTVETGTRTIRRWIIPAAEPWGTAAEEISKAWGAAAAAYRAAYGLGEDDSLSGDALRFHVRDAEIVIEFTVEARAS